jgi:phosphate/sulfate permease
MNVNSTTSLKWSSILFAVLWTIWMVWWSGSLQPANVVILGICGTLLAYLWYFGMRWYLRRAQRFSAADESGDRREQPHRSFRAWLVWAALMISTGVATAFLRGLADPHIPAGHWHGLLSGLFVVVVWPSLMWSLHHLLKRHLPA